MLFNKWIKGYTNVLKKKVDGTGLFLFRIVFGVILLAEVSQMKYYRHLMFDQMPYVNPSDLDFGVIFSFWQIIVVALILGLSTRFTTIINFIFSTFFFMTLSEFEYHVFYTYQAISFLFLFLPISRGISIDSLIEKIKYSTSTKIYLPSRKVNVWSYYLPILLGIAFVYIDSFFYKINCPEMWLSGLGVWFPSTLPMATHVNLNWLLNQEYLIKFLGYITIVFEGIFLFTFWFKKWRVPLLIIGVALHTGILIVFPIPWFALTVIAIYMLMVPASWWHKTIQRNKEKLHVYINQNCTRCLHLKIIITHLVPTSKIVFSNLQDFDKNKSLNLQITNMHHLHVIKGDKLVSGLDVYRLICLKTWYLIPIGLILSIPGIIDIGNYIFNKGAVPCNTLIGDKVDSSVSEWYEPNKVDNIKIFKGLKIGDVKVLSLKVFVLMIFVFQFLTTIINPNLQKHIKTIPSGKVEILNNQLINLQKLFNPISNKVMGFAKHDVFVESHFNNYDAYFNIREKGGDYLYVYDELGMPSIDNYGTNWRFFTFEVNSPNTNAQKASDGFKRYLHFYRGKQNIKKDATYELLKKQLNVSWQWNKDQLQDAINEPWQVVGEMGWKKGRYYVDLNEYGLKDVIENR